jgi:hypothetical protein
MFEPNRVFPIFIATWIILGISSFVFFYLGKNGRLKRRLWPVNVVFVGILFVVFVSLMKLPREMYIMLIPSIFLISVMNMFMVKFCLSCGHMVMIQNPFKRPNKCSKCNSELNKKNIDDDSGDLNTLRAGGNDSEC